MPGVAGFVLKNQNKKKMHLLLERIKKSLNVMTPTDKRLAKIVEFSCGAVGIKIGFKGWEWDVCKKDKIIVIVVGEVYFDNSLYKDFKPAEIVLKLFKKYGCKFISFVDGSFNIIVVDEKRQRYLIFSDLHNRIPLYYLQDKDALYFSTEIKAILKMKRRYEFNPEGIVQLLTFEGIIGNGSIYRDVYLLLPGSYIQYERKQLYIKKYYEIYINPFKYHVNGLYVCDKFFSLFKRSMQRCLNGKVGIFLSGGYDSRLITLMAHFLGKRPMLFTFGTYNSEDVRIAEKLARKVNFIWVNLGMNPEYLKNWAEKGVYISEGMFNITRMHGIDKLPMLSKDVDYTINGFGGDYLLRFAGWFPDRRIMGDRELVKFLLKFANIAVPLQKVEKIFSADFLKEVKNFPEDYLYQFVKDCPSNVREDVRLYYFLKERMQKLTATGIFIDSPFIFSRTPYASKEIVNFVLKLPPNYRRAENLRRMLLKRYFKNYLDIPVSTTGISPKYHLIYQIIKRWDQKRKMKHYVNYKEWFKKELKEMIEDYIFSKTVKEIGMFNLSYIKKLWQEHLAGVNHTSTIGMLITFFIWLEQSKKIL